MPAGTVLQHAHDYHKFSVIIIFMALKHLQFSTIPIWVSLKFRYENLVHISKEKKIDSCESLEKCCISELSNLFIFEIQAQKPSSYIKKKQNKIYSCESQEIFVFSELSFRLKCEVLHLNPLVPGVH